MDRRVKVLRLLILVVLLGAVVVTVLPPTGTTAGNKNNRVKIYEKLGVFTQALTYIEKNYVKEVDAQELIYGAIKGMVCRQYPGNRTKRPYRRRGI